MLPSASRLFRCEGKSFVVEVLRQQPLLAVVPLGSIFDAWDGLTTADRSTYDPAESNAIKQKGSCSDRHKWQRFSVVHWAAECAHMDALRAVQEVLPCDDAAEVLFALADDSGNLPLHSAARHGQVDVLRYLRDCAAALAGPCGTHADTLLSISRVGERCRNVTHYACRYDHVLVVEYLRGESPGEFASLMSQRDSDGQTPTVTAACHQSTNCLRFMLDSGDLSKHTAYYASDNNGMGLALHAAANGDRQTLERLHRVDSASLHAVDNDGAGVVHHAAKGGHRALIEWLSREHSIPVDSTDINGRSPAFWCVLGGKKSKNIETLDFYLKPHLFNLSRPPRQVESIDELLRVVGHLYGQRCEMYKYLRHAQLGGTGRLLP